MFVPLAGDINPRSFSEAPEIDAAMLKEPSVFNGEHGIHHHLGHFVVVYDLALGTLIALKKGRDHLRLKFVV